MIHAHSVAAFYNTASERDLRSQRLMRVYEQRGAVSDREAAYALEWDRSDVSARRNDLVKTGHVVELGEKKDPDTGKTVAVWGIARDTLF